MNHPLTIEEATRLAREWVQHHACFANEVVLLEKETIARPYGWFFCYQSKQFLATQDIEDALFGNAPILVETGGQVHVTGTAYALAHYVAAFDVRYQRGDGLS
jgi:hypothetical protein